MAIIFAIFYTPEYWLLPSLKNNL